MAMFISFRGTFVYDIAIAAVKIYIISVVHALYTTRHAHVGYLHQYTPYHINLIHDSHLVDMHHMVIKVMHEHPML